MKSLIKRLSVVLLLVPAVASSVNASETCEWIRVAPVGAGFSIMMPAKRVEEVNPRDDFTLHLFSVTTANKIYLAAYGDYAPSIRQDVARELAANRDKFLNSVGAMLTDSRKITMDGHTGLKFTAESDPASFKSRIFLFGNRVHQISVAVLDGKDDTKNIDRFFASFSFSKP